MVETLTGALRFPGACDTHVHVYSTSYPSAASATIFPPDSTVDEHRALQERLGLERLVLVQPTTYGLDNSCQLDAMVALGDRTRGVMVVDSSTPVEELDRLTSLDVVGARFHMLPGGAVPWTELAPTADRIAEFGWHIQLQLDGNELAERLPALQLPVPLVIDHIGRFMPPAASLTDPSVVALRSLLERGDTWVKLSAPYESINANPPAHPEVLPLVDLLVHDYPERLVWASNHPHPAQSQPLTASQIEELALRWMPDEAIRRRILVDNAATLYRFPITAKEQP
jgi:D-galactarolactone isomerase